MKKHSEWRKSKNRARRLYKAMNAVVRRDDARAEWFNSRHAFMLEENHKYHPNSGFWFICPGHYTDQWPSLDDMFIEVTHSDYPDGHPHVPEGLYVVRRVASEGLFDKLLNVTDVNTGHNYHLWFPRQGQRVVSCGEVGETPWLD